MSGVAATFWLVFITLTPNGTQYQYLQEFGSSQKCNEVVSTIRQSDGIDWYQYGARCMDDKPPAGVYEFFIPRQG
jgi:hypothetical protein